MLFEGFPVLSFHYFAIFSGSRIFCYLNPKYFTDTTQFYCFHLNIPQIPLINIYETLI